MRESSMDKSIMKTPQGNYITQGLFLEIHYPDTAIYTLGDEDKEYKGKVYPSLKRLYLEMEDVVEYAFACKYLCGWDHWQRICNNAMVREHILKWRNELELKLRSASFADILKKSRDDHNLAASKWIADKGWLKRGAGRPSKEELEREKNFHLSVLQDYSDDLKRIGE